MLLKIISFANIKGGVGKTSCAIFLSQALAKRGAKVLVVDMDGPNNNLTDYFLRTQTAQEIESKNVSHAILNLLSTDQVIFQTDFAVDVIPASLKGTLRVKAEADPGALMRFRGILKRLVDYNFILLDTPPALVPEFYAGLYAADHVVVPVVLHRFMISGFVVTRDEVLKAEQTTGIPVKLSVLPSCVSQTQAEEVFETKQWASLKTAILRNSAIRSAENVGKPLKEGSQSFEQYQLLAQELEVM